MNPGENSHESLEWSGLLRHYSAHCLSLPARERAFQIKPADSLPEAIDHVERTAEALKLVESENFSFLSSLEVLESVLDRLEKASVLDGRDLLSIAKLCVVASELKRVLSSKDYVSRCSRLAGAGTEIPDISALARPIQAAIDDDGLVKDSASPLLKSLREQERRLHSEARDILDAVLQQAFRDGLLQDKYFDFREGRYLIPVKAEYRNRVAGFVVESSASRATVFMEPAALRSSNDRIKQTQLAIEEEVYRILDELSRRLHPHASEFVRAYEVSIQIDLCLGRAQFAREYSSLRGVSKPSFGEHFLLEELYHPLLAFVIPKERVVRNTFRLGPEKRVLVISGPNTGGKTVLLKAVGLCALMARCGFYLPCAGKAELPFFEEVLAQIGDSQNLELSLSSFSGSVLHLKRIVEASGPFSLILVDEILHATDPDEATALSRAILEDLQNRGSFCVVTTHLNGLKVAGATGFESASMEFDPSEMSPTYRLRMGVPGSSRALEIALRLGLSPRLVEKARSYLSAERIQEQTAVDRLEARERELESAKEETRTALTELEQERELLRAAREELSSVKKSFRHETLSKIRQLQAEAMHSVDQAISNYREKLRAVEEKHEASLEAQKVLEETRARFNAVETALDEAAPPTQAPVESMEPLAKFRRNGPVYVKAMHAEGILLSEPRETGKLEVAVGNMKLRLPLDQLTPIAKEAKPVRAGTYRSEQIEVDPELNVIGRRVDEALDQVESYLDKAARSGRPSVRIVHGHGSGALKNAIRKLLRSSAYELKYRPGTSQEGGEGCTVVEFT